MSQPTYVHRYYLFADAPGAEWVRGVFARLGDSPDESRNCRTPLVSAADPTGPAVAYCCSWACGEATRSALESLSEAGQVPAGVYWCRADALPPDEGRLRATNHPRWAALLAQGAVLHFDHDYTLAELGLAVPAPVTA